MTNTSNNDDDREYETTRRMKWICSHATTIQDMIDALSDEVELLTQLRDRGVVLMGAAEDDYAKLVTTDKNVVIDFENCGWGYWEGNHFIMMSYWKKEMEKQFLRDFGNI